MSQFFFQYFAASVSPLDLKGFDTYPFDNVFFFYFFLAFYGNLLNLLNSAICNMGSVSQIGSSREPILLWVLLNESLLDLLKLSLHSRYETRISGKELRDSSVNPKLGIQID